MLSEGIINETNTFKKWISYNWYDIARIWYGGFFISSCYTFRRIRWFVHIDKSLVYYEYGTGTMDCKFLFSHFRCEVFRKDVCNMDFYWHYNDFFFDRFF